MINRVLSWIGKTLLGVVCLLFAAILVAVGFQYWMVASFERHPPLGELVDVGDHRLHIHCSGTGPQTVILEAGGGSWSADWNLVQSQVEAFTKVCSYDRAGFGWSERGSEPRTINRLVSELHMLLENAELNGPYIMVGASFGGSIVQLFEKNHPELVSALVLVDGRSKEFSSRFKAIAPAAAQSSAEQAQDIAGLDDLRLLSATLFALGTRQTPPEEMPSELRQLYAHLGRLTKNLATGAKENIVDLVSDQQMQGVGFIGEKPLVVISHGQKNMFNGLPEAQSRRAESLWIETQGRLAEMSTNSRSVVAEQSGHDIQYEQPNLIARQIEYLVAELESSRP